MSVSLPSKAMSLLALALMSCAGTTGQHLERELCDTRALVKAQAAADLHCPLDKPWETCPEAARIEAEFTADMEGCS